VDSGGGANLATISVSVSAGEDADGDRVGDDQDNCPGAYNSNQSDFNGNGVGDACDDVDTDGYYDAIDNCTTTANDQADLDGDGIGDGCEGDFDADGDVDQNDLNILLSDRDKTVAESSCRTPCDLDGDGKITALDSRKLVLLCTRPRCATQ
jgi:hypothetical protein